MSTSGDFLGNKRVKSKEDKKIDEGIALLVKREPKGKRIFKCYTCKEYTHFTANCPKRENKYKKNFYSRRSRNFLYANDEEESKERSESEDELGFVSIKEDSPKREVALVSQGERKKD